jgi:acyl carrier protein
MIELTQEGRVLAILENTLGCPEELLTPTSALVDDLGLSTLDMETLRLLVNRDCGVLLELEDMAEVKTLEDLYDLVREKAAK